MGKRRERELFLPRSFPYLTSHWSKFTLWELTLLHILSLLVSTFWKLPKMPYLMLPSVVFHLSPDMEQGTKNSDLAVHLWSGKGLTFPGQVTSWPQVAALASGGSQGEEVAKCQKRCRKFIQN